MHALPPRSAARRAAQAPRGLNSTTINGVNDRGELVGFYEDSSNNTDGMLAIPQEG